MNDMWKARTTLGSHASSSSRKPSLLVYGPDTQEQNESKAKAKLVRDKMAYNRRIKRLEYEKKVAIRDARARAAATVKTSIVYGPMQFPPGTRAARTTPNNFEFETASREDFVREYNSERPRDRPITSAAVKEVYPLTDPVQAARETAYGGGSGLRAGVNPIRSKYMDVNIGENKQRTARITSTAAPVSQSFDRRELEAKWKSNDYETRAQKAAKKRIESARVRAASAAVDRVFPRPPSAPGFEYRGKPSPTALAVNAEKARRKAFEDRATRLREARVRQLVRSGTPVPVEVPKPAPVRRPVVQKSNEQIRIDAEKSAAASSGATKYRYPPIAPPIPTMGPTIVGDVSPSSAARQYQVALRRTEQTPAARARRAASIAENKTRIRLEAEEKLTEEKRARAARITTNINNARAKLASNPVVFPPSPGTLIARSRSGGQFKGGQFKGGVKAGLSGFLLDPMVMDPIRSALGKALVGEDYKEDKYGLGWAIIKKYAPYAKIHLLGTRNW